ncbi:putative MINDY deubiquitinase [Lyophyllum shimeji]|uniref:MINDY deubiquitinase n=1 Tax=Lyophyllum shimeji TaxID=47721 RepID=A0A9P3Q002_LYOSH|nr:putative MINDY deubiquitinase [Lyophyllum shimeji]
MSDLPAPTLQSSQADVWYLKKVEFRGKHLQIITQNFNGPCSFIAICSFRRHRGNILILRGNITIEPPTRTTVSYEFLSQLVAEYLLVHSPNVDISDALSIMPHTQKGLDLNPSFTSPTSFLAATQTAGGELKLFSQAGIDLVHGWLVDPESPEAMAMREEQTEDYDSAVALIAEADYIAGGLLVPINGNDNMGVATGRREEEWTDTERRKIRNALTIRQFLEQTQSQLTYHGLFHLASTLPEGALVALFRNSHLSVLYKSEGAREWQVLDDTSAIAGPAAVRQAPAPPAVEAIHPPQDPVEAITELVAAASIMPDSVPPFTSQPVPGSAVNYAEEPSKAPVTAPAVTPTQETNFTAADAPSATESTHGREETAPEPRPPASITHPSQTTTTTTTTLTPSTTQSPPPPARESALYTLATDQVFLNEPSVVWERIEDVDGSAGLFVDSHFVRASPAGGDWAGRTAEDTARDIQRQQDEAERAALDGGAGMSDHELARQLQAQENQYARQEHAYMQQQEYERQRGEEEERRQKELAMRREKERKKQAKAEGRKKDCVIM